MVKVYWAMAPAPDGLLLADGKDELRKAAGKALDARDKAARERRWNGLVKSGGAEAWRENYNTDGRTW